MEMNTRELPGYQIGYKEGFLEGEEQGMRIAAEILANREKPIPLIILENQIVVIEIPKE